MYFTYLEMILVQCQQRNNELKVLKARFNLLQP